MSLQIHVEQSYFLPGLLFLKLIFTCADYGLIPMRWYAKRFLHPNIVASYNYIFIWDEDLGVEHFNLKRYIELVKKHGLAISQPGLEPNKGLTWQMTKRRGDSEFCGNNGTCIFL